MILLRGLAIIVGLGVIAANLDESTQQLCAELDSLGIARVFLTPERAPPEPTFVSLETYGASCELQP